MKLLIINADQHLCALISSIAERERHQVWYTDEPQEALGLARQHAPDVILGTLELGVHDGAQLLEAVIQRSHNTPTVLVASLKDRHDPVVQRALERLDAYTFIPEPVSVLNLMDVLRRLQPPETSVASTGKEVSAPRRVRLPNLLQVAQIWAEQHSGVLTYAQSGQQPVQLSFHKGSVRNPADLERLKEVLHSRTIQFSHQPHGTTSSDGDPGFWSEVGQVIWTGAHTGLRPRFMMENLYQSISFPVRLATILALPIDTVTYEVLMSTDRATPIQDITRHLNPAQHATCGGDLYALERLRFITLTSPATRRPQPRPPDRASSGSASTSSRSRYSGIRPRRHRSTGPRSRDASGARSSTYRRRGHRRTGLSPRQLERFLDKELERFASASPALFLMTDPAASPEEKKNAATRLYKRYHEIAQNPASPASCQEKAEQLCKNVLHAYERLQNGDNRPPSQPQPDTNPDLPVMDWKTLFSLQKWSAVDRLLSQRHKENAIDPEVMAHLGWARIHNQTREPVKRKKEGMELITLAWHLTPNHSDVRYFYAETLIIQEKLGGALRVVSKSRSMWPEDLRFEDQETRIRAGLP